MTATTQTGMAAMTIAGQPDAETARLPEREECDDGNDVDTDGCTNACRFARCGDGVMGPGEECDDGNDVNSDACTNGCTQARCGDGINIRVRSVMTAMMTRPMDA